MRRHNFNHSMAFSDGDDVQQGIVKALKEQLPTVLKIHRAARENDIAGVDYWLEFPGVMLRGDDVKVRKEDHEAKGQAGLALDVEVQT